MSAPAQSEKARRRSWYDYWAGIASLCLFTILTAVAAPQEPLTSYSLLVGVSPDRTNSVQLQGSTVSANIYVSVSPESEIVQVRFFLDDPGTVNPPFHVENFASYDFAGTASDGTALPFDTATIANGSHTITAAIDVSTGGTQVVTSTFTVTVNSLVVKPRVGALTFTQSQQFTTTISKVTWSVDGIPGGSASVGTIDPSGLYSPPSGVGIHTVQATSATDLTQSATALVAVTDFPGTFTYHNDSMRMGQNLQELALNPITTNQTQFGKIFSCVVDGYVYAQPLYVANVPISDRGTHNVVFVATEHDSVFAFDADKTSCLQLWMTSFIDPASGITTVLSEDVSSLDIVPEIGITGTPVIDPQTGSLYVVAKTKENGSYVQRLHALDMTTGAERFGGPVVIQASVPGTGDGSAGGQLTFDPLRQNQRAALLLANGVVYIAFASHSDNDPYHGWVLGYDSATLQQVAVFNATPNGSRGGIWQSGGGLSADSSGNIFVITGNGTFDANTGGNDFGDSFLKLGTNAGGLTLVDFFTPFNQAFLEAVDFDLGSTSPLLLPDQLGTAHPHLVLGAGKDGNAYLVDRDNMGQFNSTDNSQIVQTITISPSAVFGVPAFWENNIYFLPMDDVLKAFQLNGGLLSPTPTSQASTVFGFPGASPAISANGSTNGIVWVLDNSAFATSDPAVLHAYNATDVSLELYNSTQADSRDQAGPAVKFTVPTVANGRVYVGGQNQLTVFGLLP